ncbi:phosphatidylserine/phosphatidylglycerophosphate/cardiolipin synthase family protein [Candidatus Woesearchaeota archaeon]|nr:phosphatidylserine/phosphatidylglycerophosphate/cardiolipin synthase family protein [Candidatus Woesearchaeota archaeon]MCF7901042.1 phosphatidylserine/phosphatidylglycerophosphate/cardiolipin synthase family protein [Candidatus Woesearchaeota archaeon]MCF8013377.1 phosphatidylserine/phosphatidylglycerophosphate/cardiolipin synthase family protein [Candidatus Woesearchaeota archaeon]
MDDYTFIGNSEKIYESMVKDIESAKKYVYLESFIYDPDNTGSKFRDLLLKKVKQGVEVKILLDWFGSNANKPFFKNFEEAGGEIRFTRRIRFHPKFFLHVHERDHRKLLIIDGKIAYVGSINFSDDALKWRECAIRCEGGITKNFKKAFVDMYAQYNNHLVRPKKFSKILRYKGFEILRDVPSWRYQRIRKKLIYLIKNAKKEITIEMAYFLPDAYLRYLLKRAVKKGVLVTIILPFISDVRAVDILREKYTGKMHKKGLKIFYYTKKILHSKIVLVDDKFIVGSSNIDGRTFIHNYEISLYGNNKKIVMDIKKHLKQSLIDSKKFNYEEWKKRSIFLKVLESIMSPFKQWM